MKRVVVSHAEGASGGEPLDHVQKDRSCLSGTAGITSDSVCHECDDLSAAFLLDRAPNADARSISDHLFLPRDFLLSGQECLG